MKTAFKTPDGSITPFEIELTDTGSYKAKNLSSGYYVPDNKNGGKPMEFKSQEAINQYLSTFAGIDPGSPQESKVNAEIEAKKAGVMPGTKRYYEIQKKHGIPIPEFWQKKFPELATQDVGRQSTTQKANTGRSTLPGKTNFQGQKQPQEEDILNKFGIKVGL